MVDHLEIPFSLVDEWEEKLITQGKCATFWEIAQWGYKQRLIEEDQFLMQIVPPPESMTNHPIIPSPELLQLWWEQHNDYQKGLNEILIEAAQWGADKQLAEDAKWLDHNALNESHLRVVPVGEALKETMRPRSLSPKKQSLALIDRIQGNKDWWDLKDLDIVRRTLEQLDD